tara:strand:+ start:293 stop:514 length:222 start_codon:yes stop_codon:yes gene_type:complete
MSNWEDIVRKDDNKMNSAREVADLFDKVVENLRQVINENDGFDKPDTVGKGYAEIEDKLWKLFDDLFPNHNLH